MSQLIKKFKFSKLVRDNIPELIEKQGGSVSFIPCESKEKKISYYKKKLLEESLEVSEASTREELLEEIADCLDVVDGFKELLKIDEKEFNQKRGQKNLKKGAFKNATLVESVELPLQAPTTQYCLKDPKKYPEII